MNEKNAMDNPNLPFAKPAELERLERLSPSQRDAMDKVEAEEHIQDAADSLAMAYQKSGGSDKEACVAIITAALTELGGSFRGKMGALMVGLANRVARKATETVFAEEE